MAILSKKLLLESGVWQLVSTASGFVGQKKETTLVEICNADSLPSGDVEESQVISEGENLQFPKPSSGNLYARVSDGTTTLKYYEV